MWFLIVLLVIILIIAFKSIKVVRQSEVYIIERLGKFHKVADAGLTLIIPFFDHVRSVVSLKQQTMDIPPQGVITKDNVTITIDTVVFYQITDPAKAVYEIQSLKKGIEYLAITTIRDIVGKMDLDATFSSRDGINSDLRAILDDSKEKSNLLKSIGLNMNLAPVVDVPTKSSAFIYDRSYGRGGISPYHCHRVF